MDSPNEVTLFPKPESWIGWTLLFLILVAGIFNYPRLPERRPRRFLADGIRYFFQHNFQFRPDVVFSYGPLGFSMGKTYSGLSSRPDPVAGWASPPSAQAFVHPRRPPVAGALTLGVLLGADFFGISYEDALANAGDRSHRTAAAARGIRAVVAAASPSCSPVLSVVKFTNLMARRPGDRRRGGTGALGAPPPRGAADRRVVCRRLSRHVARVRPESSEPAGIFSAVRGDQPGLQRVDGISTPWSPLWKAFVVLGILAGYLLLHLKLNPDKPAPRQCGRAGGFLFITGNTGSCARTAT